MSYYPPGSPPYLSERLLTFLYADVRFGIIEIAEMTGHTTFEVKEKRSDYDTRKDEPAHPDLGKSELDDLANVLGFRVPWPTDSTPSQDLAAFRRAMNRAIFDGSLAWQRVDEAITAVGGIVEAHKRKYEEAVKLDDEVRRRQLSSGAS